MFVETRIERFAERLKGAAIPLRFKLWNGRNIDLDARPAVTVKLASPGAVRYLLRPTLEKLGEAYVEGHLQVEGPIREVVRVGAALAQATRARLRRWPGVRTTAHSRGRDAKAIRYHYDVSNEFYRLWLDRHMAYSCAYFHDGTESIDTAQEQKFDHICRKLRLAPGERFLDVGCGWSGLVCWAARHYGVQATGITLSRNQHEYANARIRELGLADRCEVLLQDYRDVPGEGSYDKIASIGMFEHVGLKNLPVYFGTIRRLLAERGLVMNHGITDNGGEAHGAAQFIGRYVFPDSELPRLSVALDQMANQDLEVIDVESLRFHYAQTLSHWTTRLEANREAALEMVGDRRYRIWLVYLAGCAYAFEHGSISIYQVVAAKARRTGMAPVPWTRADLYAQ